MLNVFINMNQAQGEAKIGQMIEMIQKEAQEKASQILDEARQKVQKEKNKIYNQEYEKLIVEIKEKEENEQTQKRLEKSRKINETRLDMQKFRNSLLEKLKVEIEGRLRETIKDQEKYRNLLKQLLLQGALRLLEKELFIMCRNEDVGLIEGMLGEVQDSYRDYIKEHIGRDTEVAFTIIRKRFLTEEDVGGVILYCNNYKIVYNNSLKSRLDLAFEGSVPDMRRILFPSLENKP